ncbi:AraC-like DNA-binding protein [Neorhizobium galegae]|uniref:helix-turn-helix domain-containing protein n=1 Tax=Rhizobium/Agrobacterium group TaxID=227290 RepID=UPI001AEA03BE|nr:AraC family transcriptional regulator [Neorhizobium galegae]MBP2550496.1 AraC-like DNA-binding protein [Neorhizobium galegae]
MTFQPRMSNTIEGFSLGKGVARRVWNGLVADVWDVECAPYAGGHYVASDPRLFILLDLQGTGRPVVRSGKGRKGELQNPQSSPISYVPAGMDLWVDFTGIRTLRHLDIHFDAETICRRLTDDLDPRRLDDPKLLFFDERAMSLARLIAAECLNPQPLHDLYGDGLALSLIIAVLNLDKVERRKRSALAPWQLRRATDYLDAHCLRTVRLDELADLTGLSASQFSHSFKASTGLAPHQWQMRERLARAKAMLAEKDLPLNAVAVEIGFADQAHFTRVFRQYLGTTPAKWRKAHS